MNGIKQFSRPAFFILLVAAIGLVVAFQGWNSRHVNFDLLPYIDDAREFIRSGRIPEKGTLTSFGSYTPPGITWLVIPGAYFLSDPRVFQSVGGALLYIGTLVGIFLVARAYVGTACAYLAVVLWGLSELGLHFAEGALARGHPFFFVWMVYWTGKWAERQNTRYLAAALATWAIGMYVFLEIAPALFIIPVIWILYRPPLRIWPLFLAGVLIVIVWFPYLQFELTRGFADLKSQVFRQKIRLTNFKDFWCKPALAPKSWEVTSAGPSTRRDAAAGSLNDARSSVATDINSLGERGSLILNFLLLSNFNHAAPVPVASLMLLVLTLAGVIALSVHGFRKGREETINFHPDWPNLLKWVGISTALFGIIFNELAIARYLSLDGILEPTTISKLRWFQAILVLSGFLMVFLRRSIAAGLARLTVVLQSVRGSERAALLAVSLMVPWLILLSMTEVERLERFWWLWPLQVVTLVSLLTYLPVQLGLPRRLAWIGASILVVSIGANSFLLSRLTAWARDGWSGRDSEQIQVVDYIAAQMKSAGKVRAPVGYETYIYRYVATFHSIDPRYKVGADFDLLFQYRHGITNTNRCAEGIAPNDKYRIVQISSSSTVEAARQYINIPPDERFYLSEDFGRYRLFQRDHSSAG